MGIENPVHLIFIGIIALLVLGPKRLPELARALGHGIREFREAVSNPDESPQGPIIQPVGSHTPVASPLAQEPATHTPVAPPLAQEPDTHPPAAPPAERPSPTIDSTAVEEAETASQPVDPAQPIRSGDAPDRRSL